MWWLPFCSRYPFMTNIAGGRIKKRPLKLGAFVAIVGSSSLLVGRFVGKVAKLIKQAGTYVGIPLALFGRSNLY